MRKIIVNIIFVIILGLPCYSAYRIYEMFENLEEGNSSYLTIKNDADTIKSYLLNTQEEDNTNGMYRRERQDDFFKNIDFEFCKLSYELLPFKVKPIKNLDNAPNNIIISSSLQYKISQNNNYQQIFKGKKYSLYSKNPLKINQDTTRGSPIFFLIIKFLLGMILTLCYGGILLKLFILKKIQITLIEFFISSFVLGIGVISSSMFLIGLLGTQYNYITVNIVPFIFTVISLFYLKKTKQLTFKIIPLNIKKLFYNETLYQKIYLSISFLLLLSLWGIVCFYILSKSSLEYPGYGIWAYKAKLFFMNGFLSIPFFTNSAYESSHQSYPIGIPLYLSYLSFMTGHFNEMFLKIIHFLFSLFVPVYILVYFIRETRNIVKSTWLMLLVGSALMLIHQSYQCYVDSILLLTVFIGVSYIMNGLKEEKISLFKLAFLFLGLGCWIKNEGSLYFAYPAIFLFLIDFIFEKRTFFKQIIYFLKIVIIPIIIFVLPWYTFRLYNNVPVRMFKFFNNTLLWMEDVPYLLSDISTRFLQEVFVFFYNSGGIWIVFIILLLLYPKKIYFNRRFVFCVSLAFAIIATFIITLLFSTMSLTSHLRATGRILLIPTIILIHNIEYILSFNNSTINK